LDLILGGARLRATWACRKTKDGHKRGRASGHPSRRPPSTSAVADFEAGPHQDGGGISSRTGEWALFDKLRAKRAHCPRNLPGSRGGYEWVTTPHWSRLARLQRQIYRGRQQPGSI